MVRLAGRIALAVEVPDQRLHARRMTFGNEDTLTHGDAVHRAAVAVQHELAEVEGCRFLTLGFEDFSAVRVADEQIDALL